MKYFIKILNETRKVDNYVSYRRQAKQKKLTKVIEIDKIFFVFPPISFNQYKLVYSFMMQSKENGINMKHDDSR